MRSRANQLRSEPHRPARLPLHTLLLEYSGLYDLVDGTVAMAHRAQPSLEYPASLILGARFILLLVWKA